MKETIVSEIRPPIKKWWAIRPRTAVQQTIDAHIAILNDVIGKTNRAKLKCKFRLRTPKSEEETQKLLLYQWTNKKALWLLEAELSIDWHCRTDGWFSPRTCRIAALTLSLVKKQNLTCPFSRNFAKLRHKKMRWFLLFIRISNAGEYKYFISLESLGGGQRDSMKNWIFKIPDFCLKPLSPVTNVSSIFQSGHHTLKGMKLYFVIVLSTVGR